MTKDSKSLSLLAQIINQSTAKIFLVDSATRFHLVNKALADGFGTSINSVLGKTAYDFFPKPVADGLKAHTLEVLGKEQGVTREVRLPFGNSERVELIQQFPVVIPETGEVMMGGIVTDITTERNTQAELEIERQKALHASKLASLGEMSAGLAHEINNPLAIIAGNLGLIARKQPNLDEKLRSQLDAIGKAATRIEKIVRSLKMFSRSSVDAPFEPLSLNSVLQEAIFMTEGRVKRAQVNLTLQADVEPVVEGSAIEIEQVLINLINNAVDAVKDLDSKWIKLITFIEGNETVLQVQDSGSGITPEIESKLFQPFFTTKPVGEGTGLGLSIIKGILDGHHASIRLNRSFKNTCFEIRFKAADASRATEKAAA